MGCEGYLQQQGRGAKIHSVYVYVCVLLWMDGMGSSWACCSCLSCFNE